MTLTKITGVRGVSMGFQHFFQLFFAAAKGPENSSLERMEPVLL
jgi:hypothetical protein